MSAVKKAVLILLAVFLVSCTHDRTNVQSTQDDNLKGFNTGTYGLKVYNINSLFYPFVMVYFRTMDMKKDPLINLTPYNVGLMVEGKAYDNYKKQFVLETLQGRTEGIRTTIVLDCSASMWGQSFHEAIRAVNSYINIKAPSDEIALIAVTDKIEIVTPFIKDKEKLSLLLRDLKPTGSKSRLYDGIARAMQLSYTSPGSTFGDSTEFSVLNNIIVVSDGRDDGSLISADSLVNKLSSMNAPVPIYSLAYSSESDEQNTNKLQLLSESSYGRFWNIKSTSMITKIMDEIQSINRHDYVLTFRSYLPVDGKKHNLKIILNYEGRAHLDNADFETMDVPLISDQMRRARMSLERRIPALSDGSPYLSTFQSNPDMLGIHGQSPKSDFK